MALSIHCRNRNGTVRCLIEGELDLASQESALETLTPVIERRPDAVILDLSGVEFIDSTGLRVLITCRRLAADARTQLVLAAPSEAVRSLFEMTKMTDRFDFAPDG